MKMVVVMVLLYYCGSAEGRDPVLHRVGGGKFTWAPHVNFSDWSTHEQFYVGDWLYFGFDKHIYNVLEVNETSYKSCNEEGFIQNITRGGRDVFNLTHPMTYYFLSGRGFCFQGMKLAVLVQDYYNNNNYNLSISPFPSLSKPTNLSPYLRPYNFIPLLFLPLVL